MRHKSKSPIRRIREPFGKAGLTVAVVALAFAMVGGAYAAGALSTQQKKEVEKIARKAAGNPGPIRVGGTPTPGAPAPAGADGKDGTNGKDGSSGADGKSVEIGGTASGCPAGGVTVQVSEDPATKKEICNGENGETGFAETLPSGKTETGVWAGSVFEYGPIPISFGVPLAAPISEADTVVIPEGGTPPATCQNPGHTGSASVENPEAEPGFLCVYVEDLVESEVFEVESPSENDGAGTAGTYVILHAAELFRQGGEPNGHARGTWAVTAP